MGRKLIAVGLLYCLFVAASIASPIVTFDHTSGVSPRNLDQNVGWQFDVLLAINVTGLGWYDHNQDGLESAHEVGIWNHEGTLLASGTVPAGTAGLLDNVFRTVKIEPLELGVGAGYVVGGLNYLSSGDRLLSNVTQSVASSVRFIDATFSPITGILSRPTGFSLASNGFYGPMVFIREAGTLPAPTTIALFSFGFAGLAWLRSRISVKGTPAKRLQSSTSCR